MPSSELSRPAISSSSETRRPKIALMTVKMISDVRKTKPPMATMPVALVKKRHSQNHDDTTNGTNPKRVEQRRCQRLRSDRHQTGQSAVQHHSQVNFAVRDLSEDQRSDSTSGRSHVGVGKDLSNRINVSKRTCSKLRATVKAEPTHPKDECTQSGKRHGRTHDRTNRTISGVFTNPWTKHDGTSQSGKTTSGLMRSAKVPETIDAVAAQNIN